MQPPNIFHFGKQISNSTLKLPKNGQKMSILCKSEFDILWTINQRLIGRSPKLLIGSPGLYLCRAKINDTDNSYVSFINVLSPPGVGISQPIIEGPKIITVGDPLKLSCLSNGTNLVYSWFIDGKNTSFCDKSIFEKNTTTLNDSHFYFCRPGILYLVHLRYK